MSANAEREPLDEGLVQRWRKALLKDDAARAYLRERMVSEEVESQFELGWDRGRITIPVRDPEGTLVGARRHKPRATEKKVLNHKGWGRPTRLLGADKVPEDGWVLIAGGELDLLAARSAGLVAVCGTNGEGSVPAAEQLEVLRGRKVAVVVDSDEPGRLAATKWIRATVGVADEVRDVELPGVKDVNEWFTSGRNGKELFGLVEETETEDPADYQGDAGEVEAKDRPNPGPGRRDPQALVAMARTRVREQHESRNETGFWLAAQMRDELYSAEEAWDFALRDYQEQVADLKPGDVYSEREARDSISSAFSLPPRDPSGARSFRFNLTELGNAERLVAAHGEDMRWVPAVGAWFVWTGKQWQADTRGELSRWMKEVVRNIRKEADGLGEDDAKAVLSFAARSETAARMEAAIKLARTERGMAMEPSDFDSDPMLLNCLNGSLDLTTGKLHPHRREDYCRRIVRVAYDPGATAPGFDAFFARIQPDGDARRFLQKAVGYSLTGRTDEQKMILNLGSGSNGKSTFMELVHDLLGEYGTFLPAEALAKQDVARIPNDIARLDGARLASVMEFQDSTQINERMVKQLTGGDTVTARYLYQEFFSFRPQCTIWVSSNHHPLVRGTNDGIWRRFLLVPFNVKIPPEEADRDLRKRLRDAELPGILRWAVEGAVAWGAEGLNPPSSILAATQQYRDDSDVLAGFLADLCEVGPEEAVSKSVLYDRYKSWCLASGLKAASSIGFGRMLKERAGLEVEDRRVGKNKTHTWFGIGLRPVYMYRVGVGEAEAGGSDDEPQNEPPSRRNSARPSGTAD